RQITILSLILTLFPFLSRRVATPSSRAFKVVHYSGTVALSLTFSTPLNLSSLPRQPSIPASSFRSKPHGLASSRVCKRNPSVRSSRILLRLTPVSHLTTPTSSRQISVAIATPYRQSHLDDVLIVRSRRLHCTVQASVVFFSLWKGRSVAKTRHLAWCFKYNIFDGRNSNLPTGQYLISHSLGLGFFCRRWGLRIFV